MIAKFYIGNKTHNRGLFIVKLGENTQGSCKCEDQTFFPFAGISSR